MIVVRNDTVGCADLESTKARGRALHAQQSLVRCKNICIACCTARKTAITPRTPIKE
jgi:hypothetical protein